MSAVSARVRLRTAAALCLLPLGLAWSAGTDRLPGADLPSREALGAQAPARVLLVFAAAVLVIAAARTRAPATRRAARVAAGSAGGALALALAAHAVAAVLCLLGALALVVPLLRPRNPGVFVPTALRR